jgi:hypothetical protein
VGRPAPLAPISLKRLKRTLVFVRRYIALIVLTIVTAAGCTSAQARNPAQPAARNCSSSKILWVSRVNQGAFTPLRIQATLNGANQTVTRQVAGGPGPSIIDLPAAGCWSVNLSWSGHHDHLTLRYSAG